MEILCPDSRCFDTLTAACASVELCDANKPAPEIVDEPVLTEAELETMCLSDEVNGVWIASTDDTAA